MVREILDEESAASKAAKKAGLVHLGFGRYGPKKGGKATHQSKDGKLVSVGDDTGGGEPEDKPFGGDTGKDADYGGGDEPWRYGPFDVEKDKSGEDVFVEPDEEPKEKSASRKEVDKVTSGTKAFSDKDTQETFDNIVNDENQRGRDIVDYAGMNCPSTERQHDNLVYGKRTAHLMKSRDPADKLKLLKIVARNCKKNEMSRTGTELESISEDYRISSKHTLKVTPDGGIILYGRRGKIMMNRKEIKNLLRGLKQKHIPESLLRENPAAAAAAAMATVMLMNKDTGRKNKAITALRDRDNPAHGKAVGIFQKLKDKFTQKKKEKAEKQRRADIDVALKKMGITPRIETIAMKSRTDKELGENKMNESIQMHTISGNKKFMTKTAIPIIRKYGIKNMKANSVGGYFLELRFLIDSNKLKKLDKELKRKNKTAYGGIIENRKISTNRRDKMKEAILRKVIREEIKRVIKEDEDAFSQPIPAGIERYMKKFIAAVQGAKLNRKRTAAILGRVVAAMNIEPGDLMKYIRLVKKGL